jgi:class 3 adenylate cyclase/CHASE2 domain-containing sensor protein
MLRQTTKSWFTSANVSWKLGFQVALVCSTLVWLVEISPIGSGMLHNLVRNIEFSLRDSLHLSPKLDQRVRIYGLDDQAASRLGSGDLSITEWALVFETIAKRKPALILFDHEMTFPWGHKTFHQEFVKRLKNLKVPVLAAAFTSDNEIAYMPKMSQDRPEYNFQEENIAWLGPMRRTLYGPNKDLVDGLAKVGHVQLDSSFEIRPMIKLDADKAIPYLGLMAANNLAVADKKIIVNGAVVPVDRFGRMTVNLSNKREYLKRGFSLNRIIRVVESKDETKTLDDINEGDIVIILPAMFTGRIDFKSTPLGNIQGGFILAAVVNSVVTKQWIRILDQTYLRLAAVFTFALLGTVIAISLNSLFFWAALSLFASSIIAMGLGAFVFLSMFIPWFFPSIAFLFSGIVTFAIKSFVAERKTQKLRDALSGMVPPEKLDELLASPGTIKLEPSGRIVTIMFIDIVGFSLVAETQAPQEAFLVLKSMLSTLTKTIHSYGGIIDKTLGDGLLCFFGYNYDGKDMRESHADQALNCAIEIQRINLDKNLAAAKENRPIYPLRIGINTAAVCIGDVGDNSRLDFTVIGHGVNYAKRLEESCDISRILLGAVTHDMLLTPQRVGSALKKRLISIKHHKEVVEVYECNPVVERVADVDAAIELYRKQAGIQRIETRWPVPPEAEIYIETQFGDGRVVNFSQTGVAFLLERYLAKGVESSVHLYMSDEPLREALSQAGITPLFGEIRWGKPVEDKNQKFMHGIQFKGANESRLNDLNRILREYMSKKIKSA